MDYKTGRTPAAKYEPQLVAYARALRSFVTAPLAASLVYLDAEREPSVVDVDLGEEATARAEALAAEFVTAVRDDGSFGRGVDADCRTCPFRDFCPEATS